MLTAKCVKDYNPFDHSRYFGLEKGQMYEVEEISIGASYSFVSLKDKPGNCYNSICFEFYEDDKPLDIYRDKRFYPL